MTPERFQSDFAMIVAEVSKAVVGRPELIAELLVAIIGRGHVLLEGVPGLGKTLLVRALAEVVGCDFKRIQFTPDLMPSDVTGGNVFDQREHRFSFLPGPIFTQLCLADEINRAPAKTQAALLEAMQDRSVTADGVTRPLPAPFFVIATQNPIESQGTYPLPEAQLDRFLFKLRLEQPAPAVELEILRSHARGFDPARLATAQLQRVCDASSLLELQGFAQQVRVDDSILSYIVQLVERTRQHRAVALGASPRASISMLGAARVMAAAHGRSFVTPDDVKRFAAPVLRHRLILHPDAELEGVATDACIEEILREVPVPRALD